MDFHGRYTLTLLDGHKREYERSTAQYQCFYKGKVVDKRAEIAARKNFFVKRGPYYVCKLHTSNECMHGTGRSQCAKTVMPHISAFLLAYRCCTCKCEIMCRTYPHSYIPSTLKKIDTTIFSLMILYNLCIKKC